MIIYIVVINKTYYVGPTEAMEASSEKCARFKTLFQINIITVPNNKCLLFNDGPFSIRLR